MNLAAVKSDQGGLSEELGYALGKVPCFTQLTLPNDQNEPAVASQTSKVLPIPCLVAAQLWEPIVATRFRQSPTILMPMPEAAMYEDHCSPTLEDKIRRAGKLAHVKPVAVAQRMNEATD